MDQSKLCQFKTGSWSEHNKAWMSKMSVDAKNRQILPEIAKLSIFGFKKPNLTRNRQIFAKITKVLLYQQFADVSITISANC